MNKVTHEDINAMLNCITALVTVNDDLCDRMDVNQSSTTLTASHETDGEFEVSLDNILRSAVELRDSIQEKLND